MVTLLKCLCSVPWPFVYLELHPALDAKTLGSRKLLPTMRVSLALMQLPLSGRISMLMMALSQLLLFPKVINRQHTKIICPRRGMWLNKFLSNSKELQGLPLKIEQIVLKISTYWTMHCAFSGAESDTFRFRIVLQDKPLTQLESYQPSVLYTNPWDSLSTSNPDWKTSSLEPLPRRWERWRNT